MPNVLGIVSLPVVQAWSGFLCMVLGLHLQSAAAWNDDREATWSILVLAVSGLVILCSSVVGFVCTIVVLIEAGGTLAMIVLSHLVHVRVAARGRERPSGCGGLSGGKIGDRSGADREAGQSMADLASLLIMGKK